LVGKEKQNEEKVDGRGGEGEGGRKEDLSLEEVV
jgi:hypothetical protein